MTNDVSIDDLEKALLDRANALSKEYAERAKRSYEHYIEDENERLRLREEREEMAAKMQAEQIYRRMVQTEELLSIKRVDQLRWKLMQKVIDDVYKQLQAIREDQERYLPLIKNLLQQSLKLIPAQHLIVELNADDYHWLSGQWSAIMASLNTDKDIQLVNVHSEGLGGFMIYDEDYKIRVNNTFQGVIERSIEDINQIIAESLFSELIPIRSNIHEG